MTEISYTAMLICISVIWCVLRGAAAVKNKGIKWKREAALLTVYICIAVVVRFTFCPFGKVDGRIQPLLFDLGKIVPFWINLRPLVYLFDYPTKREIILNLVGNIAMFIPLGIVWPAVFRQLDTPAKAIAAGAGFSLCIELLQLPFFGRATDIDDLILNSAGYIIGYGLYLVARTLIRRSRRI